MTSDAFVVDDLGELLALQRVFREAKFSTEPDDVEVSYSPVVARLFERLMATLIAQEIVHGGDAAGARWTQWLSIDDSRDEWAAAVRRAKADARWLTFSDDERVAYVRVLLSPFTLSTELVGKFIHAVDQS